MYNWNGNSAPSEHKYLGLILFVSSALLAVVLFLIFHPQIEAINRESPILINLMFIPAMSVGFLYGIKSFKFDRSIYCKIYVFIILRRKIYEC